MLGGPSPRIRPWIVIIALFLAGWFSVSYRHEYNLELPVWLQWLGVLLVLIGTVIWVMALREIGLSRKIENLVTSGIYSRTRNPVYLATIVAVFGGAAYSRRLFAFVWAFLTAVVLYWVAKKEESELEKAYGERYLSYKKRVPLLVPRLGN
jgi:protein-S-isoprenylcysteine O-methyltransferase Ste14